MAGVWLELHEYAASHFSSARRGNWNRNRLTNFHRNAKVIEACMWLNFMWKFCTKSTIILTIHNFSLRNCCIWGAQIVGIWLNFKCNICPILVIISTKNFWHLWKLLFLKRGKCKQMTESRVQFSPEIEDRLGQRFYASEKVLHLKAGYCILMTEPVLVLLRHYRLRRQIKSCSRETVASEERNDSLIVWFWFVRLTHVMNIQLLFKM